MLLGGRRANPQPALISISDRDGPGGPKPRGGAPGGGPPRPPRGPPNEKLNIMSTGTGPLACFGVVTVSGILTSMEGQDELSTIPWTCFSTTGTSPIVDSLVSITV